jgi:pilus assembly protein CpaB
VFKLETLRQNSIMVACNPAVCILGATCPRWPREKTIAMKRNMIPLLGIAFVAAIICTGIYYGLFAGKLRSSNEIPGHSIVVAARDLDRGTVVQASDLRVAEAPGVLTGSFSKPEAAVGATLLTPLKTNEPLLAERVVPPASLSGEAASGMVPEGMRAISIRVSESDGLLSALRPGARVDLQAISERENNQVQLRNILQNVVVLAVGPQDPNANRAPGAIVTVLAHAQDADLVALSDAGGKIRLTLRNPFDEGTTLPHAMALAAVYSNQTNPAVLAAQVTHQQASASEPASSTDSPAGSPGSPAPGPVIPALLPAGSQAWDHPVQLHVQVLNASDGAWQELGSKSDWDAAVGSPEPAWRVGSFRSGEDAAKLIRSLEQKHEVEVVSSERLMAGVGRPITYHAGAAPYRLRVEFSPELTTSGRVGVRLKPEISAPGGSGVSSSKYDAGLSLNSSFLLESGAKDHAPERLFPGHSWEQHHLLIFVTASPIPGNSTVASARTGKGR